MKKRLVTVLIVLTLTVAMLVACTPAPTATNAPTATPTPDISIVTLPLTTTPTTFKVLASINEAAQDYKDNVVWKKVAELTGVTFEFQSVLSANYGTEFNLMLASKQYPDLFMYPAGAGAAQYPGGLEQGVDDGVILDIKSLIPTVAPLYWQLMNKPEVLRDALTDKGYLPAVYQFRELYNGNPSNVWGMMIRQDWLTADGLSMPTTVPEWYTVLKSFKDKHGADFPLLMHLGDNPIFMQAYGIITNPANRGAGDPKALFYPDADNKMHFGGVEQGYADYLKELSKWYAEGLYDRDFSTRFIFDLPGEAAIVGQGEAGATGGYLAWKGMFFGAAKDQTGFQWVAAPAPKLTATSDKPFEQVTFPKYLTDPWVITKACKNPELVLKLFNWMCTEEGSVLMNYGIEGDSYTKGTDGKLTFTDKILKNDKGATAFLEIYNGNFQPKNLSNTPPIYEQLNDAATLAENKLQLDSVQTLYVTYGMTADESTRLNAIMADVTTYIQEQYVLAVMDPAVAATWMDVQAKQMNDMDIAAAIEIVQGAWDRYMAKK